jgi:hypothetical protein
MPIETFAKVLKFNSYHGLKIMRRHKVVGRGPEAMDGRERKKKYSIQGNQGILKTLLQCHVREVR